MKPYAFGIDIGGTTVKCGFFNSDGTFVEKWEIPTRKEDDGAMILPDIAEAIKAKLAEHNVSMDDVEGIGVGVPGPVLDDGMMVWSTDASISDGEYSTLQRRCPVFWEEFL